MSEAIATLADIAVALPDVFRVQAFCDVENRPSQRALEKAGLVREGRHERFVVHPNASPEPRARVSLSQASHLQWIASFDLERRTHIGPFFGWLNAWLEPYPDTRNLKTRVHLRDAGLRPYIELEPTEHPLSREQREGISPERAAEIYRSVVHDAP